MGFDINGVWTSNFYPIQDKEAGIAILASKFQTLIQTDIKSGFNNCITRDGSGKPTANLNLNGHKIINLASGVNGTDAVTKGQMDTAIAEGQSGAIASSLKLFEFKPLDYLLDDMSWLRADTFSWHDGTVYTNAYNHLVDDIDGVSSSTETIAGTTITYYLASDGHKIVLADQETNVSAIYTATGVAWYYILDTDNIKFKLPRTKYGFVGLRDGVGNYVEESLPQHQHFTFKNEASGSGATVSSTEYPAVTGTAGSNYAYGIRPSSNIADVGLSSNANNSTYQTDAPVQQRATQTYLYFYVGQFTQTATQQTAGLNAELFNDKVDLDGSNATFAHVVETYSNGTEWYRVWSDGWCEQGGVTNSITVTFVKDYGNTNYTVNLTYKVLSTVSRYGYDHLASLSSTGFTVAGTDFSVNEGYWEAKGYIS